MAAADIEAFYSTHKALFDFLLASGQPTFASETSNNFRRSLILAIASSFEHEITSLVREIPRVHAGGAPIIQGMIETKFVSRQYHTYFDWDKSTANKFFSLFGAEFSELAKTAVQKDAKLSQAIKDFLELGDTRNKLVHLDYVTFDVDKSPDDVMALYRSALTFIAFLHQQLLGET